MGPAPLERAAMRLVSVFLLTISLGRFAAAEDLPSAQAVLVVVGAPGTDDYAAQFKTWASRWKDAAEKGHAGFAAIGLDDASSTDASPVEDRSHLERQLAEWNIETIEPLWLVLIGHGTFDGKTARFNLRGPDVSSGELTEWLKPMRRPVAVLNCASASGPFLANLSGPNRVVVTATRSGSEYNFARLGDFLSSAIADPAADLDKDNQVSLLEAFLFASARLREFYSAEARLATEHSLIDDNGDGLGTPAEWFQNLKATKRAKDGAALDGAAAARWILIRGPEEAALTSELRTRRDELEAELAELRSQKTNLPEAEYLDRLESLLSDLGRIYLPQP
jgi:hypothetical protein